ncbi:hypothetical protein [Streptomyces kurssanovii]|uniref:Uncharacterized protein n=1 Tax=Streptomyces kurssanovii TaxID=67312 RepID=A0ABV3I342_9ACTN
MPMLFSLLIATLKPLKPLAHLAGDYPFVVSKHRATMQKGSVP